MGLFSERNKNKTSPARREKLTGYIAAAIIKRQTEAATYLNRKTQYWNKSSKIVALAIFSLVFGGISLYLLIKAIY